MAKELATSPGRGRKHCPGCNKYPGVRSAVCSGCGHKFEAKKPMKTLKIKVRTGSAPTEEVTAPVEQPTRSSYTQAGPIILIPRGKPPVKLEGTSIEEVKEWMRATREAHSDGYLTYEALCYWVRYFYPFYSMKDGKFSRDDTGDVVRAIIRKLDGVSDEQEVRMVQSEGDGSEQNVEHLPDA